MFLLKIGKSSTVKMETPKKRIGRPPGMGADSTETEKKCRVCCVVLPVSEFYFESRPPLRYWTTCKHCTVARVKKWTDNKFKTDANFSARRTKTVYAYRKKNKQKAKAHIEMTIAIRNGILCPRPCAQCGNTKTEGHHEDYSKPLDVVWLCRKHHAARHNEINRKRKIEKISKLRQTQPHLFLA